jgi:hypothetical protein
MIDVYVSGLLKDLVCRSWNLWLGSGLRLIPHASTNIEAFQLTFRAPSKFRNVPNSGAVGALAERHGGHAASVTLIYRQNT